MRQILIIAIFIVGNCYAQDNTEHKKKEKFPKKISSYVNTTPEIDSSTGYEINKEYSKEIGYNLVEEIISAYYDAIRITSDAYGDISSFNRKIKTGEVYINKKKSEYYNIYEKPTGHDGLSIGFLLSNNQPKIIYAYGLPFSVMGISDTLKYERFKYTASSESSFKKEFIFSGKSGSELSFSYREFKNDMARPAFTQELKYDMKESDTIAFKGLRIKVIKASNTDIKYVVLKGFN